VGELLVWEMGMGLNCELALPTSGIGSNNLLNPHKLPGCFSLYKWPGNKAKLCQCLVAEVCLDHVDATGIAHCPLQVNTHAGYLQFEFESKWHAQRYPQVT